MKKQQPKKVAVTAKPPKPATEAEKQAGDRFVNDLVVREEAQKTGKDGKLPLDATHEITKEKEDGTVEVKRARFKLF